MNETLRVNGAVFATYGHWELRALRNVNDSWCIYLVSLDENVCAHRDELGSEDEAFAAGRAEADRLDAIRRRTTVALVDEALEELAAVVAEHARAAATRRAHEGVSA